ncbi:MAG: DNA polymerase III subunit alpha [Candidatus Omnitrophica bacterium]|nr:DNA polymerase III subunit alpha [Candidatus Omnitrophota bacterium]
MKLRGVEGKKEYEARLTYELGVITRFHLESYFLNVWDLAVRFAKKQGILLGPGRGSAPSSLVLYCLGVTHLDPIQEKLPFERFLNEGRLETGHLPDVDLDFTKAGREKVVKYLIEKYGKDNVVGIGTVGTYEARSSIKSAARALDLPYIVGEKLNKLLPPPLHGFPLSLAESYDKVPELRAMRFNPEFEGTDENQVLSLAEQFEGHVQNVGQHPAGIVISPVPVVNLAPLCTAKKSEFPIAQWTMETVEKLGFIKYDLLVISNLDIIEDTIKLVKDRQGIEIDIYSVPDDDRVWRMLNTGLLSGIFQLEGSPGMKSMATRIGMSSRQHISDILALYRPGPVSAGLLEQYIRVKRGQDTSKYLHPGLQPILEETYSALVYQEQVLRIASELAGFSLIDADIMRDILGKKKKEKMPEQREKFISGLIQNSDFTETKANELFDTIEVYAAYCFNRSHSRAYAQLSYWTAYLKALYPLEFMLSLMTHRRKKLEAFPLYIHECRELGLKVTPPDINESGVSFSPIGNDTLRWGLGAVKGVGKGAKTIIQERAQGPFKSVADFVLRTQGLNRKVYEALIKAGTVDSIVKNRGLALAELDAALKLRDDVPRYQAKLATYEKRLLQAEERLIEIDKLVAANTPKSKVPKPFKEPEKPKAPELTVFDSEPSSQTEDLNWEKELLGTYVSSHPAALAYVETQPIDTAIAEAIDGQGIQLSGVIDEVTVKRSKAGRQFATGTLSDSTGQIRFLCFEDTVKARRALLKTGSLVKLTGKIQRREEAEDPEIIVGDVHILGKKHETRQAMSIKSDRILTPTGVRDFLEETEWHRRPDPFSLTIQMQSGTRVILTRG